MDKPGASVQSGHPPCTTPSPVLDRLTAKLNALLRAEARRRHPRVPGRLVDRRAPQVSAGAVAAVAVAIAAAVVVLVVVFA